MGDVKIALVGYREWAKNCFKAFPDLPSFQKREDLLGYLEASTGEQILVFIGWSDIIPESIIHQHKCICFHPSDLPSFRGGSPLQHQKILGIEETKLTAFRMTDEVDAGPIVDKLSLSISGHMSAVFDNLTLASIRLVQRIVSNASDDVFLAGVEQAHDRATLFTRRQPQESEITINDLKHKSGTEIFEFICGLEDPYPNAFIKTVDGRKLILKRVELE